MEFEQAVRAPPGLLGMATLLQPLALLILGSNGHALAAAAGILPSATGLVGTLCSGGWALGDRLRPLPTAAAT